jgi:hypothetical protein
MKLGAPSSKYAGDKNRVVRALMRSQTKLAGDEDSGIIYLKLQSIEVARVVR